MTRMKCATITLAALVAVGGASPAPAQDTFHAEAGLSYSRFKSGLSRANVATAEATYFFDKLPIQPADYPLEQAWFVERVGGLSANYGRTSSDIDAVQSLRDGSSYGVAAWFVLPDTPLIVAAGYDSLYSGKSITASSAGTPFESESDGRAYRLSVGAYVDKTAALVLDWSRSRTRTELTSNGVSFPDSHFTLTSVGISGQQLVRLSGGDHLLFVAGVGQDTGEREGAPSEKDRVFFIQATYYPTKTLGLSLLVASNRGDNRSSEGESYLAGARMFVTPRLSLSLDFLKSHKKAPNVSDSDFVTLKAVTRF